MDAFLSKNEMSVSGSNVIRPVQSISESGFSGNTEC